MCVVENLSRVFLSEYPILHLWVIRVYIIWVKSKKVTLKNLSGRMFRDYLASFSQNPLNLQLSLSLYQLNTKLNTINSHKIQGTKLKQL